MSIPGFQSFMLPLLELAIDGKDHTVAEARDVLVPRFGLTETDLAELLPSGKQRRFSNRVAWAKAYLEQAGLVKSPKRGVFFITDRGRALLKEKPKEIDIALLTRYEEFRQFRSGRIEEPTEGGGSVTASTPEETLQAAFQAIRRKLAQDLLAEIRKSSPAFFEELVIEVLEKMGYGKNRADAAKVTGKSGDEGIDGVISEDSLGLDMVYVQAKHWEATVGRPEIQKFVGALHGKRARKGVFITSGSFSSEALDYVTHIEPKVVLIDGPKLAEYMHDFGVGVSKKETYEIKRLDQDYFSEE